MSIQLNRIANATFKQFRDVLIQKNLEYGPDSLTITSAITRMDDKIGRIKNLIGGSPNPEAVKDSALDLSNYALILYLMVSGKWGAQDREFIEPATIGELQMAYGEWCLEKFPYAGTDSWCDHMVKEVEELRQCGCSDPMEFADILLILIDAAQRNGVDLLDSAIEKWEINRNRSWARLEDGTYAHVKDDGSVKNKVNPARSNGEIVYLAGPVDLVRGNGRDWRRDATATLARYGISVYNPVTAFNFIPGDTRVGDAIEDINIEAVKHCTAVIVNWTGDPTVMTGIEIKIANVNGIPVYVISNGHDLVDSIGMRHCKIVSRIEDSTDYIRK